MNILFLCHRIPYPPNKGDKIRSYNEIIFLSQKHKIYLGTTLDEKSDKNYTPELEKYCEEVFAVHFKRRWRLSKSLLSNKPFSVSNFYDKRLQAYVDRVLKNNKIDIIFCFCSSMAEYVYQSPAFKNDDISKIKMVMDYVDLDSDKWRQYSEYTKFPKNIIYRIEQKRLLEYEKKINEIFNHSVFVSEREVNVFKRWYPEAKNIKVIQNGVDSEFFSSDPGTFTSMEEADDSSFKLIFTGVMDYFANEDGVKWFCRDILKKIKSDIPNVEFYIVGNRPTKRVQKLSKVDGVFVTGYVEDIRPYYVKADVCVIPLRIARGLQNKVLEAMSMGKAVVATSNASEGIICKNNSDIIIANDAESFAREVIDLLRNENKRKDIGNSAYQNIRTNYKWETNLATFEELFGKYTE